jgi:hypothetical protein
MREFSSTRGDWSHQPSNGVAFGHLRCSEARRVQRQRAPGPEDVCPKWASPPPGPFLARRPSIDRPDPGHWRPSRRRSRRANLSLMEHYLQLSMISAAHESMVEGHPSLGFLAGHNSTAELPLLVTGVTTGTPGCLPRSSPPSPCCPAAGTSGWGPAWYEREHAAMGVPYPPGAERFEWLEEHKASRVMDLAHWQERHRCRHSWPGFSHGASI